MDLTRVVQWLSTNPWVWLIVTLIVVVTGLFGTIAYFKSKRVKEPKYIIHTANLIRDFSSVLSKLDISYDGKKINNLSSTRIVQWNEGRDPIHARDIAPSDPLIINLVGEGIIVNCNAVTVNNAVNRFSVTLLSEKQASITFDFLDYRQGAVIQILHTGKVSQDVALQGTIIGAGNFALDNRYTNSRGLRFSVFGRSFSITSIPSLLLIIAIAGPFFATHRHHSRSEIIIDAVLISVVIAQFYLDGSAVLPELPRGLGAMSTNGWTAKERKRR